MRTKQKIGLLLGLVFIASTLLLAVNFTIILSKDKECRIGIIDTTLSIQSKKYMRNNICLSNQENLNGIETTHGDMMIEFLLSLNSSAEICYYNAADRNTGKITSDNLIDGLEWMKRCGVKEVNISLSSKSYSKLLEDWLDKNSSDIKIFASYNNLLNTFDYPASYQNVIGSGSDSRINFGTNDIEYRNNRILLLPSFKVYKGNSYLSVISLMRGYR